MPVYSQSRKKHHVVVHHAGRRWDRMFEGTATDAKQYEAALLIEMQKMVANELSGETNRSDEPGHSAFCQEYATHTSSHVAESTWSTRKFHVANLNDFVEYRIARADLPPDFKFSQWTNQLFDEYKRWRRRDRKVKRLRRVDGELTEVDIVIGGAVGRTINNEIKTFSTMRTFAAKERGWPVPSATLKKVPEDGVARVKFWTAAEIQQLFRTCAGDARGRRLLPVLVFLANTGCRKGEAIHAERDWVKHKMVEIDGKVTEVLMLSIEPNEHWQPKDREARDIPVSSELEPFLRLPERHPKYLFVSSRADGRGQHRPYKQFPNKTFRRLVKAAGLRGGPHKLRHSYASAFLAAEPDMYLLSEILGHSHEKVTKLYAHLLPSHRERARNKVNLGPATMGAAKFEASQRWKKGGAK